MPQIFKVRVGKLQRNSVCVCVCVCVCIENSVAKDLNIQKNGSLSIGLSIGYHEFMFYHEFMVGSKGSILANIAPIML